MNRLKIGSEVMWKLMGRTIVGTVQEIHMTKVSKLIKGKTIVRHATQEIPAYLVKSKTGVLALRLQTELFMETVEKTQASEKPTSISAK